MPLSERLRKLAALKLEETSGVDHPASGLDGWMVQKSRDAEDLHALLVKSYRRNPAAFRRHHAELATKLRTAEAEVTLWEGVEARDPSAIAIAKEYLRLSAEQEAPVWKGLEARIADFVFKGSLGERELPNTSGTDSPTDSGPIASSGSAQTSEGRGLQPRHPRTGKFQTRGRFFQPSAPKQSAPAEGRFFK